MLSTRLIIPLSFVSLVTSGLTTAVQRKELGPFAEKDSIPSAVLTVCTAIDFGGNCADIPVEDDLLDCLSLIGGFTGLNKEISSAVVPEGFDCNFFNNFACTLNQTQLHLSELSLSSGSFPNFLSISDTTDTSETSDTRDFNDRTSSINCVKSDKL
ncbi:hypothetical protein D9758_019035 [Tetrapyrgos nigripes]|uniref:Uncharacterized protein n=1 Tax=Tetrapyrgos nigripes TaxID=182062 RepID=A0A8H5B6N8_9AGAR|nr:hypothetical protein D9758_018963 [Tetrapyrgos nigripes]KAF5320391.1 hypothetical protein D9758_019035 [Tetrapyrgos nigripes]